MCCQCKDLALSIDVITLLRDSMIVGRFGVLLSLAFAPLSLPSSFNAHEIPVSEKARFFHVK